jgi:predicted ATPase
MRSSEALTRAQELSHPSSIAYACSYRLVLHQLCGDAEAALEEAGSAISLAAEQGFSYWLSWAMITRGWALAATGQPELGIAELRRGITAWRRSGAKFHVPHLRAIVADVYGMADHPKADRVRVLDKAILGVEHTREHWIGAELHRRRGRLLASGLGRSPSEAEAAYRRAIAIARSQEARLWELRAVTDLGHLLRDQGRGAEARQLIASVCDRFTESFGTVDLRDAKKLLDALRC